MSLLSGMMIPQAYLERFLPRPRISRFSRDPWILSMGIAVDISIFIFIFKIDFIYFLLFIVNTITDVSIFRAVWGL